MKITNWLQKSGMKSTSVTLSFLFIFALTSTLNASVIKNRKYESSNGTIVLYSNNSFICTDTFISKTEKGKFELKI